METGQNGARGQFAVPLVVEVLEIENGHALTLNQLMVVDCVLVLMNSWTIVTLIRVQVLYCYQH